MDKIRIKNKIIIEYTIYSLVLTIFTSSLMGVITNKIQTDNLVKGHVYFYPRIINEILEENPKIKNLIHLKTSKDEIKNSDIFKPLFFEDTIFRIKIWDKNGNIIWSDKKDIIDKNFYMDKNFQKAITGNLTYEISNDHSDENVTERSMGKIFELYIPIFDKGKIVGVIELYEQNFILTKNIKDSNNLIWSITIIVCFLYYMLLFSTFYKANKKNNDTMKQLNQTQDAVIFAFAYEAELRDNTTGFHITRTSKYVDLLVKELRNLKKYKNYVTINYIEDIVKAAPLHDIGKVGIPDSILLKPGKLTKEEFEIMKTHCQLGVDVLKKAKEKLGDKSFLDIALQIALNHHEKWDGTGYPRGLKGEEIPLSGRIMALADVYDALRTKRPYKEKFSHREALEIISSGKGKHFDPELVEIFLKIHEEFRRISIELSDEISEKLFIEKDVTFKRNDKLKNKQLEVI